MVAVVRVLRTVRMAASAFSICRKWPAVPNFVQCCSKSLHCMQKRASVLGCVYTYPDIRISGYPDLRDPGIFGASIRIGSKRFRRLHVSRYPNALYAAYSLCVGEIRKCLFFFVKLHVFKFSSIFPFFFDVCWLDDKVKVLFGMFSNRL